MSFQFSFKLVIESFHLLQDFCFQSFQLLAVFFDGIRIAEALADAFETDVNSLPLSLILSWYEQKAVAVLLALLSLGIRGIYLGPTLPAFLSPNVLQYLVDTFDLRLTGNAEEDLKNCLAQKL